MKQEGARRVLMVFFQQLRGCTGATPPGDIRLTDGWHFISNIHVGITVVLQVNISWPPNIVLSLLMLINNNFNSSTNYSRYIHLKQFQNRAYYGSTLRYVKISLIMRLLKEFLQLFQASIKFTTNLFCFNITYVEVLKNVLVINHRALKPQNIKHCQISWNIEPT